LKKSRKAAFDPKIFLAKVGDGKTISEYQKDQIAFSGDVADAVFYMQKGKIKLTVVSERGKEATTEPIIGKFSQETLSEMIGTTQSRVSFFMNKLRKLGYIEYNGKLEIRNSLLNVVVRQA
jgi:CRP/FNR family cyclic AMP-dependent transcriptional regulator